VQLVRATQTGDSWLMLWPLRCERTGKLGGNELLVVCGRVQHDVRPARLVNGRQ